MKKSNKVTFLTQAAVIAAIYVVLTIIFAPFSFGEVQVRISEALTILPFFTPAAIPGLFVGCIIANLLGGAIPVDIIFGSIAIGFLGCVFGLVLSYLLNVPSGAFIILVLVLFFLIVKAIKAVLKR